MRRHVAGVRDRRRDLRVAPGRVQRERSVHRIVEGMDHVVGGAGMVGAASEDVERDRAGANVVAQIIVAQRFGRREERQREERADLVVVGIALVEAVHCLYVSDLARRAVAFAPQRLDRGEKALLALGRRLGAARRGIAAELGESLARVGRVEIGEERVVVAQRLAPVRHREVGLDRLRRFELRDRLLPAEAVQRRHAAQEVALRLGRGRGGGEVDGPDLLAFGLQRRGRKREQGGEGGCRRGSKAAAHVPSWGPARRAARILSRDPRMERALDRRPARIRGRPPSPPTARRAAIACALRR